ncbi:MAG: hypothetical protein R3A52_13260 [Polyangiales bacterium]
MRATVIRALVVLGAFSACKCSPRRAVYQVQRAALGVTEVSSRPPPPDAGPSLGGCALFPPDNAWNQDISNLPLDPRSARYIANIQDHGEDNLHPDFGSDPRYGIPYVIVPANQPRVPIRFTEYGDESDPGPYPVPLDAPVEYGNDHHILVLQRGTCMLYELYHAERDDNGWAAGSGAVFNLRSNETRREEWTSCDQAGLPILPGLVRYEEVTAGAIRHALRVTFDHTQAGWIPPATHPGGDEEDRDAPPMGLRMRLRRDFDISGYRGAARVILEALKRYGLIVADTGSNWYISGAADHRWNDADLDQLKDVPGTAFEVVQSQPIRRRNQ